MLKSKVLKKTFGILCVMLVFASVLSVGIWKDAFINTKKGTINCDNGVNGATGVWYGNNIDDLNPGVTDFFFKFVPTNNGSGYYAISIDNNNLILGSEEWD